MKKWCCVYFLMCFLQVAAQRSPSAESNQQSYRFHSFLEMKSIVKTPFHWNTHEAFDQEITLDFLSYLYNLKEDSTRYFWLEKHDSYSDSSGSGTFEAFVAYHVPSIHLCDLDRDNDLDIVYEGYQMPGYNTKSTLVFIRHKKHYLEVLSENGIVVGLNQLPDKKMEMIVYHYPCCTEYTESLKVIEFSKSRSTTFVKQTEAIGFVNITDTRLNEQSLIPMPQPTFAEIALDSAYLFNGPDPENLVPNEVLLSEKYTYDEYAPFMANCKRGSIGRLLNSYTDELGNQWYFMELSKDQSNKFTLFEYAFYDITLEHFAGWIPVEKCRLKNEKQ